MSPPKLVVRFDIDTISCMKPGLTALLAFARKENVRFTFFVNMGRAVCYTSVVKKLLRRKKKKSASSKKMSSLQKMGWRGWFNTVLFNPEVGKSAPELLCQVVSDGHDLGLHGGKNHGAWHHNAVSWSLGRLRREVDWGRAQMCAIGLPVPSMFASPGFSSPAELSAILADMGFLVLADDHVCNKAAAWHVPDEPAIIRVNTGLLAEPGAVGYLEATIASDISDREVGHGLAQLYAAGEDVVLYDHPCLAGVQGLSRLSYIVQEWKRLGGVVEPLSSLETVSKVLKARSSAGL